MLLHIMAVRACVNIRCDTDSCSLAEKITNLVRITETAPSLRNTIAPRSQLFIQFVEKLESNRKVADLYRDGWRWM